MEELKKIPQRLIKKNFPSDSIAYMFGKLLFDLVNQRRNTYARYLNNPEALTVILQNQAYYFHQLLNRDKKDQREVIEILEWSQEDDFWKHNILSAYKFREKYETLLRQMKEKGIGSMAEDSNPKLTKKIIRAFRALINNSEYSPSPKEHTKFVEARVKMEIFFSNKDIHEDYWVDYLLDCLEKKYVNKSETIYPGHLCSDHTWGILMPQFLVVAGLD